MAGTSVADTSPCSRVGFNPANGEGVAKELRFEKSVIVFPVVASGPEYGHAILTAALLKTDTVDHHCQSL
jgi:hypothetical protein